MKAGDSLQSIAAAVWGDRSMWYLIADANGLTGTESLNAGQTLTIPNKITNIHNNSGTFRPYSPGEAIGDTSPTLPDAPPQPQQSSDDGGCGGMGEILVIVIAVVATVVTAGVAAAALAPAGAFGSMGALEIGAAVLAGETAMSGAAVFLAAAAGGAAGSMASQGAAMAMGMQGKFSWSAVATSALTSGAMAGLGNVASGLTSSSTANLALNAAARNVVGQGISLLAGQQKNFSWSSVAVSAITAPVIRSANDGLFGTEGKAGLIGGWAKDNPLSAALAGSTVSAAISATTRVAVVGGRLSWAAVAGDTLTGFIQSGAVRNSVVGSMREAAQVEAAGAEELPNYNWNVEPQDYSLGSSQLGSNMGGTSAAMTQNRYTVSKGDNGFLAIAGNVLPEGASASDKRDYAMRLQAVNPDISTLGLRPGMALNLPASDTRVTDADVQNIARDAETVRQRREAVAQGSSAGSALFGEILNGAVGGSNLGSNFYGGSVANPEQGISKTAVSRELEIQNLYDARQQFSSGSDELLGTLGFAEELLGYSGKLFNQYGPSIPLYLRQNGSAVMLPNIPMPSSVFSLETKLKGTGTNSIKLTSNIAEAGSGILHGGSKLLGSAPLFGEVVGYGLVGVDTYSYLETGNTKYKASAINQAAWTTLDAGVTVGVALLASSPIGWGLGLAYGGYRAIDAFNDTDGSYLNLEGMTGNWLENRLGKTK